MLLLSHHHTCKTIDLALTYYKLLLKLSHRGTVCGNDNLLRTERGREGGRLGGRGREKKGEKREEICYDMFSRV